MRRPLLHSGLTHGFPDAPSIALQNGVYHLNVRVPADIAPKVSGTTTILTVDGKARPVKAGDKVMVSLRTKDARLAKNRFAEVHAALSQHWQLVRTGPKPLTHKQIVAMAGVFYRQQVEARERDAILTPEALEIERYEFRLDVEALSIAERDGEVVVVPEDEARNMALLCRPDGAALLAYRGQADIDIDLVSITYAEALDPGVRDDRAGAGTVPSHQPAAPAPELLAEVVFGKFRLHLPQHRQSERFAREGVPIEV